MDQQPEELSRTCDIEGTVDGKTIKFCVIAVPKDDEDVCETNVSDGKLFPPIPPSRGVSRLPQVVHESQVRLDC